MAAISFANLDQNFSMLDANFTAFAGAGGAAAGFEYSFLSASGDWEFEGTGITASGGLPTGGIVTALQLDIDNDNEGAPEIIITGLEDLFAGTQGFDLTSFGIGTGSAANQNISFWGMALQDYDTFDFTLADYSVDLEIYGDGVDGSLRQALFDIFNPGASPLTGNVLIVGDYRTMSAGLSFANGDSFYVAGSMLVGDYYQVNGGQARSGRDLFAPAVMVDNEAGYFYFIGDAAFVTGGQFIGAADTFDLSMADISGVSSSTIIIVGDTLSVSVTAYGGRDTISGSAAGELIFGDDANNSALMIGAGDSIRGNGGDDTIYGGGGDDRIQGGPGADYIDGQAGFNRIEYLDAGAGVLIDLVADMGAFDVAQGDTLIAISDIYGSNYSDTLLGDDDPGGNYFDGFDGDDSMAGFDGSDSLIGGLGSDTLDGGSGDDWLLGGDLGGESDLLLGGDGDDVILGAAGDDLLYGEDGDDSITGSAGADFLDGGAGYDTLNYSGGTFEGVFVDLANNTASGSEASGDTIAGFEAVFGTGFSDTLIGDLNGNFIQGQFGDDSIVGAAGDDTVIAAAGADTIYGDDGDDFIDGGIDDDILTSGLGSDKLIGGIGADTLQGGEEATAAMDTLEGDHGADTFMILNSTGAIISYASTSLWVKIDLEADTAYGWFAQGDVFVGDVAFLEASQGDDVVRGNALANAIWGRAGDDFLSGRDENDTLSGDAGDDTLKGDSGNDRLFSGLGNDRADGGLGDDFARTSNGRDTLIGGDGNDTLGAGSGGDLLNGGLGADLLLASNGADRLYGGDGDDTMLGGGGRDVLIGGAGNDRLVGGSGDDGFNFNPGSGADVIVDFAAGAASGDIIRFIGFGAAFDDFADVLAASSQVGANVVIDLGAGDSITLQGVTLGNLNAGDFAFG